VTQAAGGTDAVTRFRARNRLIRMVRDRLKSSGLQARERDKELVISNPGNPDNGSVHINLATGEASHQRTLWEYLGYLPGYGSGDPDAPGVDTDAIIATLTRPGTGPQGGDDSP
jgi:hypothetical protein